MFPTPGYHGGKGTAAQFEHPMNNMFVSDHGGVATTYSKGMQRDPGPSDAPWIRDKLTESIANPPNYNGNVMPLRMNTDDAVVVDFENRFFGGDRSSISPQSPLNDVMVRDTKGSDLLRLRYELDEKGFPVRRGYLPGEEPIDELAPYTGFGTDMLHQIANTSMQQQYGISPPMSRFDNVIDIGYGLRYRGEPKSINDPNTVYVIRDGSKVRSEFAAFDPLFRNLSGLSLGVSAAAVKPVLEQLSPGESVEGALYER